MFVFNTNIGLERIEDAAAKIGTNFSLSINLGEVLNFVVGNFLLPKGGVKNRGIVPCQGGGSIPRPLFELYTIYIHV